MPIAIKLIYHHLVLQTNSASPQLAACGCLVIALSNPFDVYYSVSLLFRLLVEHSLNRIPFVLRLTYRFHSHVIFEASGAVFLVLENLAAFHFLYLLDTFPSDRCILFTFIPGRCYFFMSVFFSR